MVWLTVAATAVAAAMLVFEMRAFMCMYVRVCMTKAVEHACI